MQNPIQNYRLSHIAPYRVDTYEENVVLQRKEHSGSDCAVKYTQEDFMHIEFHHAAGGWGRKK